MKPVFKLKRIIAKMIKAIIIFAALAGLGYALCLIGGWVSLCIVVCCIVVCCVSIFYALAWALDVLEIMRDEEPY